MALLSCWLQIVLARLSAGSCNYQLNILGPIASVCINISGGEQVFLAHQRFRRLKTSWIFDFWRKTAYWNSEISVCCFPSKIKIHLKYWHSLLLLKTPFSDVSVITSCVNISGGEQVFLAHQRFRRLRTSWFFFYFWRKTAYWKFLVPWMLKITPDFCSW